jgi:hypothetical protein
MRAGTGGILLGFLGGTKGAIHWKTLVSRGAGKKARL